MPIHSSRQSRLLLWPNATEDRQPTIYHDFKMDTSDNKYNSNIISTRQFTGVIPVPRTAAYPELK